MPNELIASPDPSPALSLPVDRVQNYLENARARNTIKGYRSSFRQFQARCNRAGLIAMPATPETVALYISCSGRRTKTVHTGAPSGGHRQGAQGRRGTVTHSRQSTRQGDSQRHQAGSRDRVESEGAGTTEDCRMMLRLVPRNMQRIRDRALLLVGFAGAFRRSELVALDVTDLQFTPEGLLLTIRRSKTDQEGRPICSHSSRNQP